jgi:hypothetical protein
VVVFQQLYRIHRFLLIWQQPALLLYPAVLRTEQEVRTAP